MGDCLIETFEGEEGLLEMSCVHTKEVALRQWDWMGRQVPGRFARSEMRFLFFPMQQHVFFSISFSNEKR